MDADDGCDGWASSGECERNPGFMRRSCPLACRLCKAAPASVEHYRSEGKLLLLRTPHGDIPLRLLWDVAPVTCGLVMQVAERGACPGCDFYRNEAAPTPKVRQYNWGDTPPRPALSAPPVHAVLMPANC